MSIMQYCGRMVHRAGSAMVPLDSVMTISYLLSIVTISATVCPQF